MSKRLKQEIQNSKLYSVNWLSLTHNNDLSHEKMWNQKILQGRHIQEQKQIDRILFGIVKERLFGQLLSQDSRISKEGFYALDKLNKDLVNKSKRKPSRKICPLPNQPSYGHSPTNANHKTINIMENIRSKSLHQNQNQESAQMRIQKLNKKNSVQQSSGINRTRTRKLSSLPKQFVASKISNMQAYFRELSNNNSSLIFDIKLSRQMIVKYNKQHKIVSSRCLQRFLNFFNFPASPNIKQFSNWLQYCLNCSFRQSSFFAFQVLDQSRNGFLTISDLFRALQDFPMQQSSQMEKEIYELMEKMKEVSEQLKQTKEQLKLTVQQIIVRNQSLRLDEMRQLVKQGSKELISTDCFKSTSYHKSMYALQHSAAVRQKNMQIQYSQQNDTLNKSKSEVKQDGVRFLDFSDMYAYRRPQIFILVAKILIGSDTSTIQ